MFTIPYPDVLVELLLGEGGVGLRREGGEEQRRVQRGEERRVGTRAHPPLSHPEVHGKRKPCRTPAPPMTDLEEEQRQRNQFSVQPEQQNERHVWWTVWEKG